MNRAQLEALEAEINTELKNRAIAANSPCYPITDGSIDPERFITTAPKVLWILKEPWEKGGCGDWSLTKQLVPELIAKNQICNHPTYGPMAYVTHAVFNNFAPYSELVAAGDTSNIGASLQNIAYINVSKFPGKPTSKSHQIAAYYRQNQQLLLKQIRAYEPDIVIGGSTLTLFLADLGLTRNDFKSLGSLKFCVKDQRLYIDAYHPARRNYQVSTPEYVNEIVSVIKSHSPVLPRQSEIASHQS